MEKASQSLIDMLFMIMPELRTRPRNARTDPKTAKALYSLWSDEAMKIANKTFRKPDTIKQAELDVMKHSGLVDVKGDKIEITARGTEVVKQMILGDDRSVFEDNGKPVEYLTALANLKPTRKKYGRKVASVDEKSNEDHPAGMNWYKLAQNQQ